MIEVGDYIRTPYFNIEKVERIDKAENPIYADIVVTNNTAYTMNWLLKNNVKHSKNIIDLIEVGDYVNGHRVYEVVRDVNSYVILETVGWYVNDSEKIDEKDIKSIVTKEQFAQMEYKVGE